MRTVSKDEFYAKLMAETSDVISSCESAGKGRQISRFTYRYSNTQFGIIETSYETVPSTQIFKLA